MKKILITGGAGFIGYHLSKYLSSFGYDITIVDNFERSESDEEFRALIQRDNVHFIQADITKKETFDKLNSFDYVYHLAAINGTKNFYEIPDKVLKVGVIGVMNLIEWFKGKKGKLLFSSSSETYGGALNIMPNFPIPTPEEVPLVVKDPKNNRWSYAASKIVGEVALYANSKDVNFCIVRYHNIFGPRMGYDHVIPQFIDRINEKEDPFIIYGPNNTRAFCYVDDAVRATKLIMEGPNKEIYNVGKNEEIRIVDLAKELFKIAGVNPIIKGHDAPDGSVTRRCPDIKKLIGLGFKHEYSLSKGLSETYKWYKNAFSAKRG
jgi:nucleoside-diphosphate-sugar epimerase